MHIFQVVEGYEEEDCCCPFCGFVENTPPAEAVFMPVGVKIKDRYIIGTVIGSGGFGITYRAWDEVLDSIVCVKEYFPQGIATRTEQSTVSVFSSGNSESFENGKNRFLKEARSLAKFNSETGTVTIHDFFEANGTAYIVMEYLEGYNLKEFLQQNQGAASNDFLMNVAVSVCKVLESVHKVGLIHGDISPDNIYVCNNGVIKLIDFGAVKQMSVNEGLSSTVILKHGYAPVEQYSRSGRVGPWTDVYSLGATLYKLATRVTPPESIDRLETDELVYPDQINPALSKNFCDAIMQAMSLQIGNRFQDILSFRRALTMESVEQQSAPQMPVQQSAPQMPVQQFAPQMPVQQSAPQMPIQQSASQQPVKKGKGLTAIIAILSIVLVAMIALIVIVLIGDKEDKADNKKTEDVTVAETDSESTGEETTETASDSKDEETTEAATEASTEATTEATTDATTEAATEVSEQDKLMEEFGIVSTTVEDYSANLDPSEYLYYDSGIGKFNFKYPAKLFDNVLKTESADTSEFGTNIQTITFSGNKDGALEYAVYQRTNGDTIADTTDAIYNYEHSRFHNVTDLINSSDDDHGRVILTGYVNDDEAYLVYDLVTVESDYVYHMLVIFPDYNDEEDKNMKSYVTENVYRDCGFSGSTDAPRSYEEYLSGQ